jgi:hypothetical protein
MSRSTEAKRRWVKRPWELPSLLCGECGHGLMWLALPRDQNGSHTVQCTAPECTQRGISVEVRLRRVRDYSVVKEHD